MVITKPKRIKNLVADQWDCLVGPLAVSVFRSTLGFRRGAILSFDALGFSLSVGDWSLLLRRRGA